MRQAVSRVVPEDAVRFLNFDGQAAVTARNQRDHRQVRPLLPDATLELSPISFNTIAAYFRFLRELVVAKTCPSSVIVAHSSEKILPTLCAGAQITKLLQQDLNSARCFSTTPHARRIGRQSLCAAWHGEHCRISFSSSTTVNHSSPRRHPPRLTSRPQPSFGVLITRRLSMSKGLCCGKDGSTRPLALSKADGLPRIA